MSLPMTASEEDPLWGPARAATLVATATLAIGASRHFACDGRKYCGQMRSCDEAKYFLAHCPAVEMDGDKDGVPCEKQWCGR